MRWAFDDFVASLDLSIEMCEYRRDVLMLDEYVETINAFVASMKNAAFADARAAHVSEMKIKRSERARAKSDARGIDRVHESAHRMNPCCMECKRMRGEVSHRPKDITAGREVLISALAYRRKSNTGKPKPLQRLAIESLKIERGLLLSGMERDDFEDHGEQRVRSVIALTGRTNRRASL